MTPYQIAPAKTCRSMAMPLLLCLFLAALFSGCAGRTTTDDIRAGIASGNMEKLEEDLTKNHESYGDMVTALNLARVYQLGGRWRESIKAFEDASVLLDEYENRAVVNIREMLATTGSIFLSRGAKGYFCTGYERSLLHTFNSLNYLMLGDFSGAAVEMRRMDQRQALWLEESQARIEKYLEDHKSLDSPEALPAEYSMRNLLADPDVRKLLNNYQDPFSYSLAAILYRLAGDPQAADVSMRRAIALDDHAHHLFTKAWPPASGKDHTPKVPLLPLLPPVLHETAQNAPVSHEPAPHKIQPRARSRNAGKNSSENSPEHRQEVTVIAFTGLTPALHVENVRIWFPAIGYILVDLPSYRQGVNGAQPQAFYANGNPATLYPLLRTDLLAYRTLWDDLRMEYTLAVTRAITRAGISAAAYVAAASNDDTRLYASLIGNLTTLIMDVFSSSMSGSIRNWETLPNTGYIAMTSVPRGASVTISAGADSHLIDLPLDARGVIILANELSNNNIKVSHVTY